MTTQLMSPQHVSVQELMRALLRVQGEKEALESRVDALSEENRRIRDQCENLIHENRALHAHLGTAHLEVERALELLAALTDARAREQDAQENRARSSGAQRRSRALENGSRLKNHGALERGRLGGPQRG